MIVAVPNFDGIVLTIDLVPVVQVVRTPGGRIDVRAPVGRNEVISPPRGGNEVAVAVAHEIVDGHGVCCLDEYAGLLMHGIVPCGGAVWFREFLPVVGPCAHEGERRGIG